MDFSYFKFMNYINKHNKINWTELTVEFEVSKTEAIEIVRYLGKNGYISSIGDTCYQPTYKGKHFIQSAIFSFINVNIIDICALFVSIIALVISLLK